MSYIIYQQWIKGNERAAFPVVYNYVYEKNKFDKIDSQQPINTGSGNDPNRKHADADDIDDDHIISAASTPVYGKKAKKQKPNQRTNDIDSDDDTVGIDSVDSVETITPERDVVAERQQITVDIHDNRSNGSAVLIKDGQTSIKPYGGSSSGSVQKQRKYVDRDHLKLDINHNAVMAIDSGSESSDVSEIVNERRRQYQQRISLSSNSDSESAYATVELRNKVSFLVGNLFNYVRNNCFIENYVLMLSTIIYIIWHYFKLF